jgi:hypothetical protein
MASGPTSGPTTPGMFALARPRKPMSIVAGPVQSTANSLVSGVTVYLHDVSTGARVQTGTTDATGTCTFYVNNAGTYFAIFYKAGSPNVLAVSDFTLVSS